MFAIFLALCSILLAPTKLKAQVPRLPNNTNFYGYIQDYYNSDAYNPSEESEGGEKTEHERLRELWGDRLYPHGNFSVANQAIINYARYFQPVNNRTENPNWTFIGPSQNPINSSFNGVGQIHRITFDPNYGIGTNKTVYACSGFGGLWRTENDGNSWVNVNTDQLPISSVADVVIDPNNTNNIIIGTGLADGGVTLEYSPNWANTNPIFTIGMYRSTDYGTTWTEINNGFIDEFYTKGGTIRKMEIDNTNHNIVFAATSNGIYKTDNAFSTTPTWTNVFDGLVGTDNDFRSIVFKPNNSSTIYASSTNIFRSSDGGLNWSSMTGPGTGLDLSDFDPYVPIRINLAVSPANPNRLFANIFTVSGESEKIYIYYYDGNLWHYLYYTGGGLIADKTWIALAVSPVNADEYYFYGNGCVMGSHNLTQSPVPYTYYYHEPGVYADGHTLVFQPNVSNPKIFYGHHGGISLGDMSQPYQWIYLNNGLENMLHWSFDDSEFNEDIFITANQDCHSYIKRSNGWNVINPVNHNSDSYTARSSRVNPNLFFVSTTDNQSLYNYDYSTNTESNESSYLPFDSGEPLKKTKTTKTFPLFNLPNDEHDYFGFCEIYKRNFDMPITNLWEFDSDLYRLRNALWTRQITEVGYSISSPDTIYVATGGVLNTMGLVLEPLLAVTNTGGTNGTNNPSYSAIQYPGMGGSNFPVISGIAVDPNNAKKIWISMIGYDNIDIRVASSSDGGVHWVDEDPNHSLPTLPINGIVYQNGSNNILYVATDAGIYYKDGTMTDWEEYGDFPHVRVTELKINYCNNKLRAATFGRSLWEGDLLPSDNSAFFEVKNGQTLTWEKPRALKSSIRIKDGGILIIKSAINMPIDSKIIVEQGGKLYIEGGTLSNNCGHTWQGIEVWGNSHDHQWPDANGHYAQGYVNLDHATIKNAICALDLMKPGDNGTTGGIVFASSSDFINNTQSVHATSYTNFHPVTGKEMDYQAHFDYCNFELNPEYISAQEFFKHVDLSSLKGVRFDACNFMLSPDTPNVNNYNHGIASYSASFSVNGVCNSQQSPCPETSYDRCTFNGFYYGISANVIDDDFNGFYVNRAEFTNNTHGIFVNGINNYIVIKSNFYIGRNKCDNIFCSTSPGYGIYSSRAHGFSIEENNFRKADEVISTYLVGILIDNTNDIDIVYKNTFDGLSYGNFAKEDNLYNSFDGLSYLCNINTNNYADFFTPDESQVEIFQGDRTLAAGNLFSTNATWHFYNNGVTDLTYYYCPTCIYEVPNLAKLNRVNRISAPANTCPSHYTGDIKLSEEQKLALENEFAQATTDYNSVSMIYSELEDGGSTESKLTEVSSATTNDMLVVKQDLLGTSPHLSESVLKAVADKTEVFPDAAIFDILAANPEEMKNSKFLKHLQEKQNPLPQYMIDILKEVSEGSTYKSVLQQDMAKHGRKKSNAALDQIRSIINDTIIDYDELRNWLDNLGGIEADMQIIETYMHQKNYNAANSLAQTLPSIYSLEGKGLEEYGMYMSLLNLEQDLDSTRTYADLTDTEFALLQSIADSSKGKAGAKAKGIIRKYYGGHFYDCINLDENSFKSSPVNPNILGEVYGLNITCNPNPAKEWTTFDYTLPDNQTSANLSVFDNTGKLIFNKTLNGPSGQYIWDTRKIMAGQYVFILNCAGFNKSCKITVIN
jgi:hypothetical protein